MDVVLDQLIKKTTENPPVNTTTLKILREKKKISRAKISKLTSLSVYQVEGLEGKGVQNQIDKIMLYVRALGYKADDVLNLMDSGCRSTEERHARGMLGTPKSETSFEEGVKLLTYMNQG